MIGPLSSPCPFSGTFATAAVLFLLAVNFCCVMDEVVAALRLPSSSCSNLSSAAAPHHLLMGAAISLNHWQNNSDPEYRALWKQQYQVTTAENECKWLFTEPNNGDFQFDKCSSVLEASRYMRGHNLCWGTENPSWILNSGFNASELLFYLKRHITTVVGYYRQVTTKIISWDVVNEAVSDGGADAPLLKPSAPWYPAIPNYVDIAFQTARAANPNVLLFYNDYGAEDLSPKSDRVYQLVSSMKARGIPIDGVGLEMHIFSDDPPNFTDVAANIKRLGDLGLVVHITEMDVFCGDPCNETREAEVYVGALQACLSQPHVCQVFETWDFTDRYSWLYDVSWNPFHLNVHPLPFSFNYTPKPAYYAMLDLLCRT